MIEELRALFADLYAVGCEHENYAYALSDALNAKVDEAMLKAFEIDLENLVMRCELVSETEKYTLERMKAGRIPARPRVWYKFFRRVPNAVAKVVDEVLEKGALEHLKGTVSQVAQIEWEVIMSQQGDRQERLPEDVAELAEQEEPTENAGPEEQQAPSEALQSVPEETSETEETTGARTGAAETPSGDGGVDGAELWDDEEFDEEPPKKVRKERGSAGKRGRAKSEKPKRTTPPGDAE